MENWSWDEGWHRGRSWALCRHIFQSFLSAALLSLFHTAVVLSSGTPPVLFLPRPRDKILFTLQHPLFSTYLSSHRCWQIGLWGLILTLVLWTSNHQLGVYRDQLTSQSISFPRWHLHFTAPPYCGIPGPPSGTNEAAQIKHMPCFYKREEYRWYSGLRSIIRPSESCKTQVTGGLPWPCSPMLYLTLSSPDAQFAVL